MIEQETVFTVGGTVQAEGGVYVERKADVELFELCRAGKFAYVLTSRQMGKSSLMTRVAEQLKTAGVNCAIIDLNKIGTITDAERWFAGLLVEIANKLELTTNALRWWRDRESLGVTHRFTLFFKEVVLRELAGPVVVSVDEIDSTLALPFTDDFFAAIRSFYTSRADEPDYHRLSFVLIGSASPGDLVKDANRTPFNIGTRVDLEDFTFNEAAPILIPGLGLGADLGRPVLEWVFEWTHGHPYLTLNLCRAIHERPGEYWSRSSVTALVKEMFLGEKAKTEYNLQFVRDMLTRRSPDLEKVLEKYREIRHKRVRDEESSVAISHLKLSGIVRREGEYLVVRNKIYDHVFNDAWISGNLPAETERAKRLKKYQRIIAVALAAVLVLAGIVAYVLQLRAEALKQQTIAARATALRDELVRKAETESRTAESARNNANRLSGQLQDLLNNGKDIDVRLKDAGNTITRLTTERDRLQQNSKDIDVRLKDAGETITRLTAERDRWQQATARQVVATDDETARRKTAQTALDEANKKLAQYDIQYAALNRQHNDLKAQMEKTLPSPPAATGPTGETGPPAQAGQRPTRINETDGLVYVQIPAGKFIMGCSPGAGACDNDEKPAHEVEITRGFWIGQTPVTQAAYEKVVKANPSRFKGADKPVEMVSWDESETYCEAVGLRLPTEAEWEYAARAGSKQARYGDLDRIAWYSVNSKGQTQSVAAKQPNAWGLYDMLGNVWEWTADWYDKDYYKQKVLKDPPGPTSGAQKVVRGGSWGGDSRSVRVSDRVGDEPTDRSGSIGFRCAGELR